MTVPTNSGPFSVAELVTCQNTSQGSAPLIKLTLLPVAVTNDDEAWKMYTPGPSSVSVPVMSSAPPLYTPGVRV